MQIIILLIAILMYVATRLLYKFKLKQVLLINTNTANNNKGFIKDLNECFAIVCVLIMVNFNYLQSYKLGNTLHKINSILTIILFVAQTALCGLFVLKIIKHFKQLNN